MGNTTVAFGSGDDKAVLRALDTGGAELVDAEGAPLVTLTPEQTKSITLDGGLGDDFLQVDHSFTGDVTLLGDVGDDLLIGGAGNDQLDAGTGRDVLYGLGGADHLLGGTDVDYLDGGPGDDRLEGGTSEDQLLGGRGADSLDGGTSEDVLAGGEGLDQFSGNTGLDTFYTEANETVSDLEDGETPTPLDLSDGEQPGHTLQLEGDPNFQAQASSDLDALRSVPAGRELLSELDADPHVTTLAPQANTQNSSSFDPENWDDALLWRQTRTPS